MTTGKVKIIKEGNRRITQGHTARLIKSRQKPTTESILAHFQTCLVKRQQNSSGDQADAAYKICFEIKSHCISCFA